MDRMQNRTWSAHRASYRLRRSVLCLLFSAHLLACSGDLEFEGHLRPVSGELPSTVDVTLSVTPFSEELLTTEGFIDDDGRFGVVTAGNIAEELTATFVFRFADGRELVASYYREVGVGGATISLPDTPSWDGNTALERTAGNVLLSSRVPEIGFDVAAFVDVVSEKNDVRLAVVGGAPMAGSDHDVSLLLPGWHVEDYADFAVVTHRADVDYRDGFIELRMTSPQLAVPGGDLSIARWSGCTIEPAIDSGGCGMAETREDCPFTDGDVVWGAAVLPPCDELARAGPVANFVVDLGSLQPVSRFSVWRPWFVDSVNEEDFDPTVIIEVSIDGQVFDAVAELYTADGARYAELPNAVDARHVRFRGSQPLYGLSELGVFP